MINAPDVFAIEDGLYVPQIAVEWFNDPMLGVPKPRFAGRTLRYSDADGWEVAGTTATSAWKPMAQAAKTVKAAFEEAHSGQDSEGYYELIGPKLAGNPHQLDHFELIRHDSASFDHSIDDIPRTSLYAWPKWLRSHGLQGVLWVDDSGPEVRYAAIRMEHFASA